MSEMFGAIATAFLLIDLVYLVFKCRRLEKENYILTMKNENMRRKLKELSDKEKIKEQNSIERSTTYGRDDG